MPSHKRNIRHAANTMTASGRNLMRTGTAALAAGQVISRRMAMGAEAFRDPSKADPLEFTRMFTEKAVAMFAANQAMMLRSAQMAQSMMRYTMAEAASTAAALTSVSKSPPSAVEWYQRAFTQYMALGTLATRAQGAVMAPLYRKAGANARRLSRR